MRSIVTRCRAVGFRAVFMTIALRQPITLALGEFEDIVSRGLQSLIEEDPNLRLVAADIAQDQLRRYAVRPAHPTWRCSTSAR